MPINDFGEKIGGAKKDLWKERNMILDDLSDMNDAEKLTHIKKDNVWQKPDYEALVKDGLPIRVAYYIKTVRDSLSTKPVLSIYDKEPEAILSKQKKYIEFVSVIRDAVMDCKTEADVLALGKRTFLAENGFIQSGSSYYVHPTSKAGDLITNKFLKNFCVTPYDLRWFDREIEKKQFLYTDEQKTLSHYDFLQYANEKWSKDYKGRDVIELKVSGGTLFVYPTGEFADERSWVQGSYFVMSKSPRNIVARNFDSLEVAKKFILEKDSGKEENKPKKKGKSRFLPPQLAHIKRDGEDVRQGRFITGQDYLNVFDFKGGEFGNWTSEKDRQTSLNMGYEALYDLAKALKIDYKDIALGNSLSIAFGARGSGSALAHYEPMREVINLTKKRGAGSLAHEWGHALDDILGKRLGFTGFMTANLNKKDIPKSLTALMDKMKYAVLSVEDVKSNREKDIEAYKNKVRKYVDTLFPLEHMSEEQLIHKDKLVQAYFDNVFDSQAILGYLNCACSGDGIKEIDTLSDFRKEITGSVIPIDERRNLAISQNSLRNKMQAKDFPQTVKTEFYKNSIRFDELHSKTDHGYWQSNEEMFARAFACYVHDKVGGRSDFLCGHSEMSVVEINNTAICAFPVGDERNVINQCFDDLFNELKELGLLHHKEDFTLERSSSKRKVESFDIPDTPENTYQMSFADLLNNAYERSESSCSEEQLDFEFEI